MRQIPERTRTTAISGVFSMKKLVLVLVLMLSVVCPMFAQSPLSGLSWTEDPYNFKHNGLSVSQWFREQSGTCIVSGQKLTYWLYDTYWKNDGSGEPLWTALIAWAEKNGWIIDYDNYEEVSPNTALASSVKSMMAHKGCDVSVIIIEYSESSAVLIINNYESEKKYYWSDFYPLVK